MKKIFRPANILIPADNIDKTKWSVVACDQYTSDEEYWKDVENTVGGEASTLRITLPEIYLENDDVEDRIKNISKSMQEYLSDGIFRTLENSYVYIERKLNNGKTRKGIVGVLDLEEYDYNKGSKSAIRATEGTVLSRIPPRVHIRENALLELPHVMILIDDDKNTVIGPVEKNKAELEKVYDFKLMKNGGSCKGYKINGISEIADSLQAALGKLGEKEAFESKYGVKDTAVLQFAVGDGNHSLATAKTCWERTKAEPDDELPSRYALVEIVNLHDESLDFEAIHRVVFDVEVDDLLEKLGNYFSDIKISDKKETIPDGAHHFTIITEDKDLYVIVKKPDCNLSVGTMQKFLDAYLEKYEGRIDYIHGEKAVRSNVSKTAVGFLLPSMEKNELFETVIKDGALPRKTFSMGHAEDKRYYIEARKIK